MLNNAISCGFGEKIETNNIKIGFAGFRLKVILIYKKNMFKINLNVHLFLNGCIHYISIQNDFSVYTIIMG